MRQSFMTPEELRAEIKRIFGDSYGLGRKYAKAIGKSEVTISRQLHGVSAISKAQVMATKSLKSIAPAKDINDFL